MLDQWCHQRYTFELKNKFNIFYGFGDSINGSLHFESELTVVYFLYLFRAGVGVGDPHSRNLYYHEHGREPVHRSIRGPDHLRVQSTSQRSLKRRKYCVEYHQIANDLTREVNTASGTTK